MVYCQYCKTERFDGPEICPKCKGRLTHVKPDVMKLAVAAPAALAEISKNPPVEPALVPEESSPQREDSVVKCGKKSVRYLITLNGKTQNVTKWARELALRASIIYKRLRDGLTPKEILAPETVKRQDPRHGGFRESEREEHRLRCRE